MLMETLAMFLLLSVNITFHLMAWFCFKLYAEDWSTEGSKTSDYGSTFWEIKISKEESIFEHF